MGRHVLGGHGCLELLLLLCVQVPNREGTHSLLHVVLDGGLHSLSSQLFISEKEPEDRSKYAADLNSKGTIRHKRRPVERLATVMVNRKWYCVCIVGNIQPYGG